MRLMRKSGHQGVRTLGPVAVAAILLAACDVTNPGPVQDEFLADPSAQLGLINGAKRVFAENIGDIALDMGYMAREIFPGGQTGAWGTGVNMHAGHPEPGDGPGFENIHEARFVTEVAIQRFAEVNAPANMLYGAYLWNGWAYRILGEWWCETVLPSTDPTDRTAPEYIQGTTDPYFERAIASFTAALGHAANDAERHAALAGRAQAHLWLDNHAEAAADAAAIDDEEFSFVIEQDISEEDLTNYLWQGNSGTFRSYTVQFTWFYDYYTNTGDPRTPWRDGEAYQGFPFGVGSLSGFGQVPYSPQVKYADVGSDFELASYDEMQLIQAEAMLHGAVAGGVTGAMGIINAVRTSHLSDIDGLALDPWPATTDADEAWTYLMRERRIELWIEARNAPDERRWIELGSPGTIDIPTWEDASHAGYTPHFVNYPRGLNGDETKLCFDIPDSEREQNPNVPNAGG